MLLVPPGDFRWVLTNDPQPGVPEDPTLSVFHHFPQKEETKCFNPLQGHTAYYLLNEMHLINIIIPNRGSVETR